MKQLLIAALIAITLFACNKPQKESINAQQLKDKYGIVLPDFDYDGDEIGTASPNSKGGAKKKANSVLVVLVESDLNLSVTGTTLTTTISENAQWAGVQDFSDITTTDGAVSICNWYYSTPSGGTKTCQSDG